MFKYQVQVLVQNQEDYSTSIKQWSYETDCEPEELSLDSNFEVMYDYFSELSNSKGYVLLEILDWYLDDIE